jgi:hypothetical protein
VDSVAGIFTGANLENRGRTLRQYIHGRWVVYEQAWSLKLRGKEALLILQDETAFGQTVKSFRLIRAVANEGPAFL